MIARASKIMIQAYTEQVNTECVKQSIGLFNITEDSL